MCWWLQNPPIIFGHRHSSVWLMSWYYGRWLSIDQIKTCINLPVSSNRYLLILSLCVILPYVITYIPGIFQNFIIYLNVAPTSSGLHKKYEWGHVYDIVWSQQSRKYWYISKLHHILNCSSNKFGITQKIRIRSPLRYYVVTTIT